MKLQDVFHCNWLTLRYVINDTDLKALTFNRRACSAAEVILIKYIIHSSQPTVVMRTQVQEAIAQSVSLRRKVTRFHK